MKKVLIITPRAPFQGRGADELDRLSGIKWFINNGYEVKVITKCLEGDLVHIEKARQELDIEIVAVLYKFLGRKKILKRFLNPLYSDGAAFEYAEEEIQKVVSEELHKFKPDLVWFDYTYLWPLYRIVKRHKIPIITRSINYEPLHFLEEDGRTFKNYLKFIPKVLSEELTILWSDILFSITPKEEKRYKLLGGRVMNLPLRGLPSILKHSQEVKDSSPLHVFFMASSYSVAHNREALLFVLKEIAPLAKKKFPGEFIFHITGSKLPESLKKYFDDSLIYEGYIANINEFFLKMDIALIPSLSGEGMQQKIFEPLCRKIPLLTSARGIAGYPFVENEHFLAGESAEDFVKKLSLLRDKSLRQRLSTEAYKVATQEFSQEKIDNIILSGLNKIKVV